MRTRGEPVLQGTRIQNNKRRNHTCRPEAAWAAEARCCTDPGEAARWPPQGANLRLTALPERICSLGVLDVDLRDGVALPALRPAGAGATLSRGVPAVPLLAASGLLRPGSLGLAACASKISCMYLLRADT